MNNKNSFSFLMSIYKKDTFKYLKECLDSIVYQTLKPNEIIIVQEGEVDPSIEELILHYIENDHPIFHFKIPYQNGPLGFGLPKSLNYGIEKANSDYIVRIDTDDINEKNRLEESNNFINKNPEIALFGSFIREFDEDMRIAGKIRSVPLKMNEIVSYCKYRNPFNGPAVVFRRDVALKLGGYPNIASNEDWCFWVNFILNNYKVANIPLILVKMRGGDGIIDRRSSKRYSKGEVMSLKYIYKQGFFSKPTYYFNLYLRFFIRLLPKKIIKIFYNFLLRK
jgi:glycosyltransferase involved in cell wall biosynthesis